MKFPRRLSRPLLGSLLLTVPWLAACGDGASAPPADMAVTAIPSVCANETRADSYVAGMEKSGQSGKLIVKLTSSQPGPPAIGTDTWDISVRDVNGAERSDLSITALPWMPDHNHGTSVKASVMPAGSAGEYTVTPLYLFMAGLWQITLKMELPDLTTDQAVFSFCIDDN